MLRNGKFETMPARVLVPGDVILCKLGDVLPADSILIGGHGELQMDQAALTGESLPVNKNAWEKLLMGSAVKRGEAHACVAQTGANTFLGKAAGLIASVKSEGHLQKVLLGITVWLLVISLVLCAAIFARLMTNAVDGFHLADTATESKTITAISVVIVILVASIPIAIEVVCTSTLAGARGRARRGPRARAPLRCDSPPPPPPFHPVGSHHMASMKVIVARLSAIEELASMSILCSDTTGTLTLNKLSLREPILFGESTSESLVFYSYLASKQDKGAQDAIDFCIGNGLSEAAAADIKGYTVEHFEPFNPTDKRTLAKVVTPTGAYIEVTKGAPQVVLKMAHNRDDLAATVTSAVQALGDRGFRSLGVGINRAGRGAPPKWEYLGVLSLYDPPRADTKDTIARAHDFNIEVKMVTGDHGVIAKETCRELGMGTNILNTESLATDEGDPVARAAVNKTIRDADGFAEVMPEHKFLIVERLRELGFVTGMTGDGVNDAPALKRADVGIAVEGATDAARAAADLVLTEPGLGVIIDAIFESRKIFQRMRNYIVYRIACTLQLLFFFFFAIMAVNPDTDFMYGGAKAGISSQRWYAAVGSAQYGARPLVVDDKYPGCTVGTNSTASAAAFAASSACTDFALEAVRGARPCVGNDITNQEGAVIPGLELCHAEAFTLPVIAMVIITILNDGCMITISGDFVSPNKHPQTWDMAEVSFIGTGLGLVACISSLILVAYCMHANYAHPGDFMGVVFGSRDRTYLTWHEVRTILYLKVSISDFLTLFSARTAGWFFERPMGRYLAIAAFFALSVSTLLALFWGDIFAGLAGAYMASLRNSKGAVLATWAYCVLWWFAQDAIKVLSHYYWDTYVKAAREESAAAAPQLHAAPAADKKRSTAASAQNSVTSSTLTGKALSVQALIEASVGLGLDARLTAPVPQNSIGRAAKTARAALPFGMPPA